MCFSTPTANLFNIKQKTMYKKNLKFLVMSKDMAKSLVAAALMVAFTTPVAANTATGSRSESGAFSKQADGIVMRTGADGSNGSNNALGGAIGIEYLDGKTVAEIKAAAVTSDTNLSDADPDKVFFLYNVKTRKFLNAGGYWGTHVSLKDYPLSLWAKTNTYNFKTGIFSTTPQTLIDFIQNLETGVGHYLGWMRGSDTDEGVFIDRKQDEDTHYGWFFELQNDGKNTYKIYTYATDSPSSSTTKYYLCANGDETDQDKNCGAFNESYIKNNLEGYDTWRVLSMKQISDLLKENSDYMTSALDLSYRLDCPGFSRGNKDIQKWKVSNFSTGTNGEWRFGLEKLYNTHNTLTGTGESTKLNEYDKNNLSSSTPYTFDGKTYTELENYQRHLGKYFCADVKNMRGVIYQDVEIKAPGSYLIECKGYSTTTKAKIFASWFDKDGKNEDKSLMHQNVLNQVSYMSKAEQAELHVSEQNMDYAGKNFYGKRKYINTVLIQVPKTKEQADGSYGKIRFGLIIGNNQNDKTVDADNEWTVFDDFRLLYASNDKGKDLILDEDRDNLDYLKDCSSNTYKNTVLHLNKTFTKDKWNSFVLPVSLKRDQFRQAFGANARLAKLSGLTSSEIQFQTVDMDKDDNAEVLTAYTPYIIFPTKIHDTDKTKVSPAYKATLTKPNGEQQDVVIKANHYDIPNVTFKTNSKNENDLSEMNTDTWVSDVTTTVKNSNGSLKAYGTFARTFGTDARQNENGVYNFNNNYDIIGGRDNLIGCYFFDKGNLYRSDSRPRGLRGFSCWFKPVNSSELTKLNLYIDGVANGTTGIDEVAFGDEEPTGKAAKGIYNMNGQLVSNGSDTTNLPAGMYIVNGKKCVVR